MSITHSILRYLNKSLPTPLAIARRRLYVPSPVFFARGISIEQTPYKDVVYVRHLRLAFFSEFPVVHTNYSPRLPSKFDPEYDDFFEGTPETIAALILRTIEHEQLQRDLNILPDPAEFLRIIAGSNVPPERFGIVFDRACCHALLGERDEALRLFDIAEVKRRNIVSLFKPSNIDYAELALNERLTAMLTAGDDVTAELRRCCHANALALGFQPAPLSDA